jgi:adenine deaminase
MLDFRRAPLHEMTRDLAATARGELPATLVVRGGTLVSVNSGEILPNMSVAVQGSRVAYVGPDASHTIGEKTRVIEAVFSTATATSRAARSPSPSSRERSCP